MGASKSPEPPFPTARAAVGLVNVTLWGEVELFVQVTDAFTPTVRLDGEKALPVMQIVLVGQFSPPPPPPPPESTASEPPHAAAASTRIELPAIRRIMDIIPPGHKLDPQNQRNAPTIEIKAWCPKNAKRCKPNTACTICFAQIIAQVYSRQSVPAAATAAM